MLDCSCCNPASDCRYHYLSDRMRGCLRQCCIWTHHAPRSAPTRSHRRTSGCGEKARTKVMKKQKRVQRFSGETGSPSRNELMRGLMPNPADLKHSEKRVIKSEASKEKESMVTCRSGSACRCLRMLRRYQLHQRAVQCAHAHRKRFCINQRRFIADRIDCLDLTLYAHSRS